MPFAETGYVSLNKRNEELCGDRVEVIRSPDTVTMVLADGLGSGVKANILATLTSKIIGTMMAHGLELEDAVGTIAQTLPVCSQRRIAYSTFSILQVMGGKAARLIQFDNPAAFLLRAGQCVDYPKQERIVYGKTIIESSFALEPGDVLVLLSDGILHAGLGTVFNFGWQADNVRAFIEENFTPDLSAGAMAALLTDACLQLYGEKPGDDTTAAVMRLRPDETVSMMVGPPADPANDNAAVQALLGAEGWKVVCGGTTSQIVGRFLGEEVRTQIDYSDPSIPPIGYIKGIDLVTEGVLTLSRALEMIKGYTEKQGVGCSPNGKDGASQLARFLLGHASHVRLIVGRADNPAQLRTGSPAGVVLKLRIIGELAEVLESIGIEVDTIYY